MGRLQRRMLDTSKVGGHSVRAGRAREWRVVAPLRRVEAFPSVNA